MATNRAPDYDDRRDEAPEPPLPANGPAPVLKPNEARQGTTHHNVRYVLGISLAGVIILYIIIYFGFFGGGAPTPGTTP
jgi:hypothetical protein